MCITAAVIYTITIGHPAPLALPPFAACARIARTSTRACSLVRSAHTPAWSRPAFASLHGKCGRFTPWTPAAVGFK
jgi:hypothetical protein